MLIKVVHDVLILFHRQYCWFLRDIQLSCSFKHVQGDSMDVVQTSRDYISAYANNVRARKKNIIQFHIDSKYEYMWRKKFDRK